MVLYIRKNCKTDRLGMEYILLLRLMELDGSEGKGVGVGGEGGDKGGGRGSCRSWCEWPGCRISAIHRRHHVVIAAHRQAHGGGGDCVAAVVTTSTSIGGGGGGGDRGGGRRWSRAPTRCGTLLSPDELLCLDDLGVGVVSPEAATAPATGQPVAGLVDVPVAEPSPQAVYAFTALRHLAHARAHALPAVHAPAHLPCIQYS